MPIKLESELSDNIRALWLKALAAIELRNYGYAISLIQAVLKETPEFLDGRKMLRKAEIAVSKGKKSLFSGFSTIAIKGPSLLKKDPMAALQLAEEALENDPYNSAANNLLKDAALAAGLPEIALFAVETLAEGNPKDPKTLHALAEQYSQNGQSEKAVHVYNRITELNPSDLVAVKRGKDAAARASMDKGGWETAKDYRDLIKDKDVAISLEQQNRVVKSEEMIDQQLVELYARAEQEPQNVDVARKIAALFEQKGEIESAVWWYGNAAELTKHTDPAIERKLSELQLRVLQDAIKSREEFLAAEPEHSEAQNYKAELEQLKAQYAEALIGEARKRVERNPTDMQLRYELGEQLFNAGQVTEAIPELQKARNNPNARLRAMNLLGQCYIAKGMNDLAVKQLSEIIKELPTMDNLKKEVLYKLGLLYEKTGKSKESLDCMKEIYDVDYGYEDVAHRVESSY